MPKVLNVMCLCCRCGAGEGCLYPNLLADADGKIGVDFRVCDLKPRPVSISGTTPVPPETVRTGDMAGWTSGERPLMTCHDVSLLLMVSMVSHGNSECVEASWHLTASDGAFWLQAVPHDVSRRLTGGSWCLVTSYNVLMMSCIVS